MTTENPSSCMGRRSLEIATRSASLSGSPVCVIRVDSAVFSIGPVYPRSPTDARVSSVGGSVPIADIHRSGTLHAIEAPTQGGLGDANLASIILIIRLTRPCSASIGQPVSCREPLTGCGKSRLCGQARQDIVAHLATTALRIVPKRLTRDFFRSLLSCSLSRVRMQQFVPQRRRGPARRCERPETGPEDAG